MIEVRDFPLIKNNFVFTVEVSKHHRETSSKFIRLIDRFIERACALAGTKASRELKYLLINRLEWL